tara:strand:+ start:236 stop:439 length:204 start_codon:yes stop_codon:yes gene_type:complete
MPDYADIIQQFIWQTNDITPELPRVHKFLKYWQYNIDAVIKEVRVAYTDNQNGFKRAKIIEELNTWH